MSPQDRQSHKLPGTPRVLSRVDPSMAIQERHRTEPWTLLRCAPFLTCK